jgi:hypothetical protein
VRNFGSKANTILKLNLETALKQPLNKTNTNVLAGKTSASMHDKKSTMTFPIKNCMTFNAKTTDLLSPNNFVEKQKRHCKKIIKHKKSKVKR